MTGKFLIAAILLTAVSAQASESQPTTNRLQQPNPDAATTTGLSTQSQEPTTTGLAAHSQRQPTRNNLQDAPQPAPQPRTR
jgi:hypothetical protein